MKQLRQHLDDTSLFIMLITLVLFVVALFAKGLTHDLLLEAGVFLVSVKLIMMAYQNNVAAQRMLDELAAIRCAVSPGDNTPTMVAAPGKREQAGPGH